MSATLWIVLAVALMIIFLIYDHFKRKEEEPSLSSGAVVAPSQVPLTGEELLHENQVRKRWLLVFAVYMIWGLLTTIVPLVGEMMASDDVADPDSKGINTIAALIGVAAIFLPAIWITYHCAYTKRGTAWLTFLLIIIPLRELAGLWFLLGLRNTEWAAAIFTPLNMGILTIDSIILLVYWIQCYRLRKVNALRKSKSVG